MKTCPTGHPSQAEDYCDVCGVEIAAPSQTAHVAHPTPPPANVDSSRSAEDAICPICSTPRAATFCELCGYNFATGEAPVEAETISPKPVPYVAPVASLPPIPLPVAVLPQIPVAPVLPRWSISLVPKPSATEPGQTLSFTPPEMLIGRSSKKRSIKPQIDLLPDDAVSHRHALIVQKEDGQLTITDLGSSNGTELNGKELAPNQPRPLQDGDRIDLGVIWYLLIKALS
jgi:hypothetical protein